MNPTAEMVEQYRQELNTWLKEKGLKNGLMWQTAEEYYGPKHNTLRCYHYWVISHGDNELSELLMNRTGWPSESKEERLIREFESVVNRNGFWYEEINDTTLVILGRERDDA